MTTDHHESPSAEPIRPALLWFSALAPPLAWVLHNVVSYGLAAIFCSPGQSLLLHAVTVATALIALAAAVVGWRSRQRVRDIQWSDAGRIRVQRAYFMAHFGLISGLFFLVVILVEGIPNFYIDPCMTMG